MVRADLPRDVQGLVARDQREYWDAAPSPRTLKVTRQSHRRWATNYCVACYAKPVRYKGIGTNGHARAAAMPTTTSWRTEGSAVRCMPSSVILPSSGCQARPGRVCPRIGPSESIVGFHRFSQFLPGPTTKASSSLTGPAGSSAATATAAWMPHARLWQPADWRFALDAIEIASRAFDDGAKVSLLTELRYREKVLGTTWSFRQDQRIRYTKPAAEASASVARLDDYRDL
jgi:hypothetical protein